MEYKITFLLVLLALAHAEQVPVSIQFVSSSPSSIVNPVYGSLRGGTMLYIKAQGHSPDPADNHVYVGTTPCIVPSDGVTDTFISCEISDTGVFDSNMNNMDVSLISYNTVSTVSHPNSVYLRTWQTPELKVIFPTAGFAGSSVNLYGSHEITNLGDGLRNMGDVVRIRLGEDICSRMDVQQEAINKNNDEYIRCIESGTQEAGKYNVTQQVVPGNANNSKYMRRTSAIAEEYFEFTALPTITGVSPNIGNIGGQYLTIAGTGFSNNPLNNSVTVDGNDCKVTQSRNEQIKCTVAPKNNAVSALLSTNSSGQQNGYFSGSGLSYARYAYATAIDTIAKFVTAVRAADTASLGTPKELGFRADMRQANVYPENQAQVWRGYFTAPTTGLYTFRGTADDQFAVYIQQNYGSAEPAASPLLQTSVHQYMLRPFITFPTGSEATMNFQAGKSYYIEAYHLNKGSTGFFNLAVEVPSTDSTLPFQVYEVDNVTLSSTVRQEVKNFSMVGENLVGTIQLKVYRRSGTKVTYEKMVNVTYGCTAVDFKSALEQFDGYQNEVITVTRNIFDAAKSPLNTTAGAARIDYIVQIYKFRTAAYLAETFLTTFFNGYLGTFLESRITDHSALITGTYTLSIGGIPIKDPVTLDANLPFDISESTLQGYIRAAIVGFEEVEVRRASSYGPGYGCSWFLKFRGYNAVVPSISVSGASLSGGLGTPVIENTLRRAYSTNLEYDPIDYRFLNTVSSGINVLVTTNGVPSVCTGSCGYTFNTFSEVTSLSTAGTTLTLALSDPTAIGFAATSVSVSVGGQMCTVGGGSTLAALTCTMTTNTDGSAILVAGDVTPIVSIPQYGIASLATGVSPLSIALTATSVSPNTGGNNGGFLVSLHGTGFPLDMTKISIQMCSKNATIRSVTNIKAEFFAPACATLGSQNVIVKVGTLTDSSITYTYTDGSGSAPTITELLPASANPGVKGTIQIKGSQFGTNSLDLNVFLSNATGKIYQLNILQSNDTYIQAGLPGGREGTFTVEVNHLNNGDSIATGTLNIFNYVFSVASVLPATGSIYGNTLLTITGQNFSTNQQNTLVYVGHTLNWFCTIESITATQIKCRTPAISSKYSTGSLLNVVVSTRLLILNSCTGTCSFSYLDATSSPTLTAISPSSVTIAGASTTTVTLTGTNLVDGITDVALTHSVTKQTTVFATASATSTSVTFVVTTALVSGQYIVNVRNGLGGTNGLGLSMKWSAGTASWSSGGSTAGGIISLSNGGGYPAAIDGKTFAITLKDTTSSYPINIVSCCSSNTIEIQIPAAVDGTSFTLAFTGPSNNWSKTYTIATSLTPAATIPATPVSVGANSIVLTATNTIAATISSIKLVSTVDSTQVINIAANSWVASGSGVGATTTFSATLNAGSYKILANTQNGYISVTPNLDVSIPSNIPTNTEQLSFNGGTYTITANNLSPASYIMINGFKGIIKTYTSSAVTYDVPKFVSTNTQTTFSLAQDGLLDKKQFTYFSDMTNGGNVSSAFDGLTNTIYGSNNTDCWIGMDAGSGMQATISRVRLFPDFSWTNVGKKILQATVEGSNDNTAWTTIATVDQTIHSGWNVLKSAISTPFRYLRFKHNSTSQCNLAEFELYGIFQSSSSPALASQATDVIYNDGFNTKTFTGAIEFRQDKTAVVTAISPRFGDIAGGYPLTLTGTNLNSGTATVTIDGIDCVVNTGTITATSLTCVVGSRASAYTIANTFTVTLGASSAILKDSFLYVLKWSNALTWGVDMPPVANDLIYVTKGTTLYVDQSTPILEGIAVEGGTLVFSDDLDLTVQAGFITMNGGRFIAGTEQHPHQHKLTFIMHGGYYGKQQPMFGNKGIGCLNCKFSMYGQVRTKTWTTLATTVNPGDTTLTLTDSVDWKVGEEIVIASTSFVHTQAEQKRITIISGTTVTVDSAFVYKHVSVVEAHGSDFLEMRAEVGLLTRNIKMMGDGNSFSSQYGSHLMLTGQSVNGFEGHIGYSEFTQCGQPQILGRYCTHFHMAGDIPTSFSRGNSVHSSFARVITIHGVHHLTVEDNVGYNVKGHNFFLEDGIETHNIIRNNLAISSFQTTRMLQTDTSTASFWITNPTNNVIGNHAAGGDFYGLWYELKPNPDGPSATMDVCPQGNPLGTVTGNVAHSNKRFGLRIFVLASRMFPCDPVRNDTDPNDPWQYNPSIQSVFSNFTVYKNLEDGVLAEETGNVVIDQFVIAENYRSGIEWYKANFTRQPPVIQNSVIIGQSQTNAHSNTTNYTSGMSGAITGKTGVFKLDNIRFFNFPAGSLMFQTGRFCDDPLKFTNIGTEIQVSSLTFTNVTGKMLSMIGVMKRDVIYDLDGSLSQLFDGTTRASGTIVYGWPHIASSNQATCPPASTLGNWDNAVMCGPTITIRRVMFTNMIEHALFNSIDLKATELQAITDTVPINLSSTLFSSALSKFVPLKEPKQEKKYTYSLPFITGRIYNIWWASGIDFSHMSVITTPNFPSSDSGIIFKFNYTDNREIFEVGPMRGGAKQLTSLDFDNMTATNLDAATCNNGDYYYDNSPNASRMFTLCQSGKNRTVFEYTEVNGIMCRYLCPMPPGTFIKQDFVREWSNATQWPNGVIPQAGDNVTLNGNWTVILDIDPAPLSYFVIDGTLIANDTRDVNITADSIHIRAGNLTAGSINSPFQHNLVIQINGNKTDSGYVVDPLVGGNKFMVVTGVLNLHGKAPTSVITPLAQIATAGSNTIHVKSSTGWANGDTLILSPSFKVHSEHEKVTIQTINADGSITLTSNLAYTHFGDASITVNSAYGTLDTRTQVGHVSRNIKIIPGPDAGWGFTVIIYGFLDGTIERIGQAQLSGVQFVDGGQLDSYDAPLKFLNIINGTASEVSETSFMGCKARCLYIKDSELITFKNNVLYDAWQFSAQIKGAVNLTFTNNLMVGVIDRPTVTIGFELSACLYVEDYIDPTTTTTSISNNFCLGSRHHGFAVPFAHCGHFTSNPISGNTAGSTFIGHIINTNGQQCQAFSYAKAFACSIGQICGSPGITRIEFSHFVMADNGRSVTLKLGDREGPTDHSAYLYNSYITAVSRPNCPECYGSAAIGCTNNHGMRMFTASANGEVMPAKFGSQFDVVCKQPVFDSKSFLENVTFDSFRQTYTGSVSACSSNFVFRPHHGGFDMTGGANLFNCQCTNCDTDSYLTAPAPSPSRLGWFGGCGDILCTGFNNYLIQDHTGTFFGSKSTIIANNSMIGDNEAGCVFSTAMNAYMCTNREDFGVLEYQNRAKDFQTRIMWPVYLQYEGSSYTTTTNGWSEWEWLGDEPMNLRFGRFASITRLNQTFNMTFASEPPHKLQVQIQKRTPTGDNNNYVIVKLHYPRPNSIVVRKNNAIIDPILLTDVNATGVMNSLDTTVCGSNIYFYTNYTTHFVVTEDAACLLEIELSETVQLTTHFSINITDFFNSNNAITNFINNLCALLNIVDTSRVKVVGVHSGSTIVTTAIVPQTTIPVNGTADPSLTTIATTASNSGTMSAGLNTMATNLALGNVIGFSSVYIPIDDSTSSEEESSNIGLIVGVAVAGVILAVGVIVTVICCMRKRAKVVEEIVTHDDEMAQDKSFDKDKNHFEVSSGDGAQVPNESQIKIKGNQRSQHNILHVHQLNENSEIIE